MNGGEERAEYSAYMEAETDAGGVSMAWGWGGVGEEEDAWVIREKSLGAVHVCACARGTHIAIRGTTRLRAPPLWRLLPSNLHSVCRLALAARGRAACRSPAASQRAVRVVRPRYRRRSC
jgi:hypothetical protein